MVPQPTQNLSSDQIVKNFSNLFSFFSTGGPQAKGADFEIEFGGVYQDLNRNKMSSNSDNLLEPLLSLRKGLYWNLDLSLTSALPIEGHLSSGYSVALSHSSKIKSLHFKPSAYIFNYTFDDVLDLNGIGASLIVYKQIKSYHIGFGLNLESSDGSFSDSEEKVKTQSNVAVLRLDYAPTTYRLSTGLHYGGSDKIEAFLSFAFLL